MCVAGRGREEGVFVCVGGWCVWLEKKWEVLEGKGRYGENKRKSKKSRNNQTSCRL